MRTPAQIWKVATAVDRGSIEAVRPLRSAVVLFLGLTLVVVDHGVLLALLPFGMGLQLTALADHGGEVRTRSVHMLATLLAITIGTGLGGVVSHAPVAHVLVGAALALVCGYAGALGSEWLSAGVLLLVVYAIFAGAPITLLHTGQNMAWIVTGGVVMIASMLLEAVVVRVVRRHPTPRPAPPSLADRVALARTHFRWNDRYALHALRLCAVTTIAILISLTEPFAHAYWIPMTVAWITRPDVDGTIDRIALRMIGTVVGLLISGALFAAFHPGDEWSIAILSVAAFVAAVFVVPNYAISVIGVTTFVFFLLGLAGFPTDQTIVSRIIATLVASALVAVAITIRPRRHRPITT